MKIKKAIIDRIINSDSRCRISLDMGIGPEALRNYLVANKNNGRLTKMDALVAISKEVGIEVMDLLEEPEPVEAQK